LGFEHGDDVFQGIQKRIEMLDCVLNACDGYKVIVEGEGGNLTQQQVFQLQSKALYLRNAYDVALKKLGKGSFN